MNKTKLTKWRETQGNREQTDSCQRGGCLGLGKKGEEIKQRKKRKTHRQEDGDCQKEEVVGKVKEGKWGINGDGRDLTWGDKHY